MEFLNNFHFISLADHENAINKDKLFWCFFFSLSVVESNTMCSSNVEYFVNIHWIQIAVYSSKFTRKRRREESIWGKNDFIVWRVLMMVYFHLFIDKYRILWRRREQHIKMWSQIFIECVFLLTICGSSNIVQYKWHITYYKHTIWCIEHIRIDSKNQTRRRNKWRENPIKAYFEWECSVFICTRKISYLHLLLFHIFLEYNSNFTSIPMV